MVRSAAGRDNVSKMVRVADLTRVRRAACNLLLDALDAGTEKIALELHDEYVLAEMTIRLLFEVLSAA